MASVATTRFQYGGAGRGVATHPFNIPTPFHIPTHPQKEPGTRDIPLESTWDQSPPGQNDWQTPVKTLPSPNFIGER